MLCTGPPLFGFIVVGVLFLVVGMIAGISSVQGHTPWVFPGFLFWLLVAEIGVICGMWLEWRKLRPVSGGKWLTRQEIQRSKWEQLAREKGLGHLERVYTAIIKTIVLVNLSLFFFLFSALMFFGLLSDNTLDGQTTLFLLTLATVFLIFGLCFGYWLYASGPDKDLIYEHGLILRRWGQLIALHWNQISHTRYSVVDTGEAFACIYELYFHNGRSIRVSRRLFNQVEQRIGRQVRR